MSAPGLVVAVDGTPLFRRTDGIGRYAANVLRATALARPTWRFVVVGLRPDDDGPSLVPDLPNVTSVVVPLPRRWYQAACSFGVRFPVDHWVPRADVLLAMNFTDVPVLRGVPSVVTVFDLTYADLPEVVEARNLAHLRRAVAPAVRRASRVTTISPFTSERLDAVLPDHAPVRLVDCGLDPSFLSPPAGPGPTLPSRYVLAVGTLEPRKNLVTLLRAWALLDPRVRDGRRLVVVGRQGWGRDDVPADVPSDVLDDVVFTGWVDDADLPGVYARAEAFVFPSLYEGFGLPLLEAMASGVPAVVSDIAPFRAIGEDLVTYVPPREPAAFAAALTDALDRPDAARVAAARDRARAWTWERSGEQMATVLQEAVDETREGNHD